MRRTVLRYFAGSCILLGAASLFVSLFLFYPSGATLWNANASTAWSGYVEMRDEGFIAEHPEVRPDDDPDMYVRTKLYGGTEQPMWIAFTGGTLLIVVNAGALLTLGALVLRRHRAP